MLFALEWQMQPRQQPQQQAHCQQPRHQSHHLRPVTATALPVHAMRPYTAGLHQGSLQPNTTALPTHITQAHTVEMQQSPLQGHVTLPPGSIILPTEHLFRQPQLHWTQHLPGQFLMNLPEQLPEQLPGQLAGQQLRQLQQLSTTAAIPQSATQLLHLTAGPTQQQPSVGHSTTQMTGQLGSTGNRASPAAASLPIQCSVRAPRQTHQTVGSASTTDASVSRSSAQADQANGHCVKDQERSIVGLVGAQMLSVTGSASATSQLQQHRSKGSC